MPRFIDDINFQWIGEDLQDGRVVPFLGAGASSYPSDGRAKPPAAAALARKLAQDPVPRYPLIELADNRPAFDPTATDHATLERWFAALSDCANLALVASWYEHIAADRDRLRQRLRQYLDVQAADFNDLHDLLARVAAAPKPLAVITTNYDDLMEQALDYYGVPFDLFVVAIESAGATGGQPGQILFRRHGEPKLRPVRAEDELLEVDAADGEVRLGRTAIFKVHGHVDRGGGRDDTFVVTEEDYVAFLGRLGGEGSLIPADLVTVLKSRRMLFLGYGLKDWNLRVLFDRITRARGRDNAVRSYAVARNLNPVEEALWAKRQVDVFSADLGAVVGRLEAVMQWLPPRRRR